MNHGSPQFSSFFWLILISFCVALATRHLRFPYALALVITGLAIGISRLLPQAHLQPEILLTIFLPPLLFEAAIHLSFGELRRDWFPIILYSQLGTLISTVLVGSLFAAMLHLPILVGLVFGALISPTDPIAVIAVFKRLGANRRLTLIVEAESLFNDATAVVLFTVVMGLYATGQVFTFSILASSLFQLLRLVIGGVLMGAAVGAIASRIHYELDDHLIEITLTTVAAFGSYLAAETLHVSGVMAVIAAGIVVGNQGMQTAMSAGTRLAVTAFWEYAAFLVNSVVFLLIGTEVCYVRWSDKLFLSLGAVVIVLIGRATIYPLSYIANRFGREVPQGWQHVLLWGGLRGALSMALALGLPRTFPQRDTVVAATFAVVLFSLLVQGVTLAPLLQRLGLTSTAPSLPMERQVLEAHTRAYRAALDELERLRGSEAFPSWAIDRLVRDYQFQQEALQVEYNSPMQGDMTSAVQDVTRAALNAEKNEIKAIAQEGKLSQEETKRIITRIDSRLTSLGTSIQGENHVRPATRS